MKKILTVVALATLGVAGAQAGSQVGQSGVELGLTGGFAGGASGEAFVHVPQVAGPVGVKVSGSYTKVSDPINNVDPVEDGVVGDIYDSVGYRSSETGKLIVLGLDGTYELGQLAPELSATLYAGGRYGMFSAQRTVTTDYNPTGETNEYSSNAFGVGAGLQLSYPVNSKFSIVGDLGVDHFMDGTITYKSSTGASDSTDPGEDSYDVQRAELNFPNNAFKAKVGVKVRL